MKTNITKAPKHGTYGVKDLRNNNERRTCNANDKCNNTGIMCWCGFGDLASYRNSEKRALNRSPYPSLATFLQKGYLNMQLAEKMCISIEIEAKDFILIYKTR